ncbi:MAG: DUF1015 domain-containing protein [Desulfobacterales bacterium]|nr:DUF1015 domain-containing protein [Desulfobacterales bacterium]
MAEIVPFKGVRYNTEKIQILSEVVTPPFDVLTGADQEEFYRLHPNNIIRIDLGKLTENDTATDNRYTRAAEYFNQWLGQKILLQDKTPALYLTSVDFSLAHDTITRFGLMALVRLEPFEKKIVIPHEKTFTKVKSDRLELMMHCHANINPIFSLYSDQEGILDSFKKAADHKAPDFDFADRQGQRHKMWSITDPKMHQAIKHAMKDKRIYIADGHHRYETGLNYRDWASRNDPGFSADHPANFIMMYLSSVQDPGLVILPAHPMLKGLTDAQLTAFIDKSRCNFDIIEIPFTPDRIQACQAEFIATLQSGKSERMIGVCLKGHRRFYLLRLKPDPFSQTFKEKIPSSLKSIDTTLLNQILFVETLGLTQNDLDDEKRITFTRSAPEAIGAVLENQCDAAFLLNPATVEQVCRIAEDGLVMPRKSTYFHPKTISGAVLYKIR